MEVLLFEDTLEKINVVSSPHQNAYISSKANKVTRMLSDHIIMTEQQIRETCWGTGNRDALEKINAMFTHGLLTKIECHMRKNEKISAYSLGPVGIKHTRRIPPELDMQTTAKLLVVNQLYMSLGERMTGFQARIGNDETTAECRIYKEKYVIWCPREEPHSNIVHNLKLEIPLGCKLMVIAPSLLILHRCAHTLKELNTEVVYTMDNLLQPRDSNFLRYDEGVLEPAYL